MGSLNYLDTQKGLMFLRWRGDESVSRSSSETTTGGGAWLWTGERRPREGTPPSQVTATCYPIALLIRHSAAWMASKRRKTYCTAPSNSTGLLFWWQMFSVKSHCVQRNLCKRQLLSCDTDTFICWGTINISNQVKWCINYEWVGEKCVYKSVNTQLHKEGRLLV